MIQYFLNNEPCNPQNAQDIKFRIDYEDRSRVSEYEITIENLIFVNEDKQRIHQWMLTYGRFVGMPFSVQFSNGLIIPYYIDFTDDATTWNETHFHAKIKRYRANANFFDRANGLSWRLVNWNTSDFTDIEYIIIPEQQPLYFITLSLALFSTAQMLAKSVREIAEGISDVTKAIIPVGFPPAPDWGAIAVAAIKLLARIAEAIALTIAMIRLMQQIIEMVMPKVRTFRDIPYLRLLQKGIQHLGYSTDFSDIMELMPLSFLGTPERNLNGGLFREIFMPNTLALSNGFPTEMDSIPTLGQAIERLEELFCLRTTVTNGVVRMERRVNQSVLTNPIPLAYNNQEAALNQRKFNQEFWKRKILLWSKDSKDVWTYDDKRGHLAELDSSAPVTPDPNLTLIKGFAQVNNPFALASRKETFTRVEKFLKATLAPAVDLFTNGGFSSRINNRIGVMVISSQYFTVNKLLWKQGNKIASNHRQRLSAVNILTQWHGSESVFNRNKEVIENLPIRMTENYFLLLSSQNVVNLSNGEQAEIVSIEWSETEHEASATILVNSEYNVNVTETVIYNGI